MAEQRDIRPEIQAPGLLDRIGQSVLYVVANVKPTTWFSPGQPIEPVATGDAFPRRFDYPVGYNYRITPRLEEGITFPQLRALADSHDITRLCIETRKDQICALKSEVRMKDPRAKPDEKRLEAARALLAFPDRVTDFGSWMRSLVEELLVIDALCIEPRQMAGGGLGALDLIDGATIKPVLDAYGRMPLPPSVAWQQVLKGVPAREFSADDIFYFRRNPRVWKVYGFSPVEQIFLTINIALRRQTHVLQYYTEGSVPEALMFTPKEWGPETITQFDSWFNSLMAGNTAERRRVKFLPGGDGAKFQETKPVDLKNEFDEWLARVACFAFSIPPTSLMAQTNRATAEQAEESGKDEGLIPLVRSVERVINTCMERWGGMTDIEFAFKTDHAVDALKQAQADEIRVRSGIDSIDEVRLRDGKEAWGIGPGIITAMGWTPLPVKANKGVEALMPKPEPGPGAGPEGGPTGGKPEPEAAEDEPAPEEKAVHAQSIQDAKPLPAAGAVKKKILVSNSLSALPQEHLANLTKTLADFFQTQAKRTAKAIARAYESTAKASKADDIVAEAFDDDWVFLVAPTRKALEAAAREAGGRMAAQMTLGGDLDSLLNLVDRRAAAWAKDRAAEMVGKKWVDGRLVDNPNARWVITETTRDTLRSEVAKALEEGDSVGDLSKRILESTAFDLDRARLVAQTEMNRSQMEGNKAAWDESKALGITMQKRSLLSADHAVPDECDDCAEAGWIPYDDAFPTGDAAPPFHPRCFCSMEVEAQMPGGEPAETEEAGAAE